MIVDHWNQSVMDKIKESAEGELLLQITYNDAKGKPTIRTVEPYEIKDGKLYAYCTVRNSIRAFRLERIQSAEVHVMNFKPRFPILI